MINIRHEIALDSENVSPADRIGLRAPSENQLDITQTKIFLSKPDLIIRIVNIVRGFYVQKKRYKGAQVGFQVPLHVVLTNFFNATLYGINKACLTQRKYRCTVNGS